jgi:hypothetical protein
MHVIAADARHMFWTTPWRGPLRVVNPGLGFRRVGMGQAEANRLLDVRTGAIASRFVLPLVRVLGGDGPEYAMVGLPIGHQNWTQQEKDTLFAVGMSPSQEERNDAALIDSLYESPTKPVFKRLRTDACVQGGRSLPTGATQGSCPAGSVQYPEDRCVSTTSSIVKGPADCPRGFTYLRRGECTSILPPPTRFPTMIPEPPSVIIRSTLDQAFFCADTPRALQWSWSGFTSAAEVYGIRSDAPWREEKPVMENLSVVIHEANRYPFPSPISLLPIVWYHRAIGELAGFIHAGRPLSVQDARDWITLNVLSHYDELSAQVVEHFEERAEDARRRAIIKAVILGAVGAMIAIALPALVAAGFQAVMTTVDLRRRREAAQDLERVAAEFEATDAGFAAEVKGMVRRLQEQTEADRAAAAAAAAAPPTAPGATEPAGVDTTVLLVGGGVAVAGAIALALLS